MIAKSLATLLVVVIPCGAFSADAPPQSETSFKGKIGVTVEESTPDWPQPVKAPGEAPNIVVILLDDIGFADTSTFGGPAQTPELDKLAAEGLRYNNFHTTAMCSPTRAALLTGRNHHRVGFGVVSGDAAGYPGYNSIWKESTASIAEVLQGHGYSTAAFGKWHNTPEWEITSTGPFDRWPTGKGFEYFYGFMYGMENQWEPARLYRNTLAVDAPATPQQGYHLTSDLADEAISWVQQHQARSAERPYFLYFATGAVHFPHHAPREWIDQYRGKFDLGWDQLRAEIFQRQKRLGVIPKNAQLTPRPKEIPAWSSLSTEQKKLYARQMEVYAGFVSHTDHEVGRLLKAVRSGPAGDNTLVLYIVGDNGPASFGGVDGWVSGATTAAEQLQYVDKLGSPDIPVNHYSSGWAWMGSTPFQYWKMVASHFGGVRDPLVVSWPAKIKNVGGLRSQFTHVNDVAATLYDVIGISLPASVDGVAQQPLDGASFAKTFDDAGAPSAHGIQYFELWGNRAIYHEGWIAAARHTADDYSADRWELYHVDEDFSQARDLAKQQPAKLRQLQGLFDQEARKNDVYPLGVASNLGMGMPSLTEGKREFVFLPSERRIPVANVPHFGKTSYRISADVSIPQTGAQGVLLTFGDRVNGFTWYVKNDHLVYENRAGAYHEKITSGVPLPRGKTKLVYEFSRDSSASAPKSEWEPSAGIGRLYINQELVGEQHFPAVQIFGFSSTALYIGRTAGPTISEAYVQPFAFTGVLEKVTVELQ